MGRNKGPANFGHVLAQFQGAWAITPEKLAEIEAVLRGRIESGEGIVSPGAWDDDGEFAPRQPAPLYRLNGSAAVIQVHGTIFPRPSIFSEWSGGTAAETIGRAVDAAAADTKVSAIVLDIDSPGGSVYGIPEAAVKILAARKAKPVHAVANHTAASAAYWLATQATTIAVAPSGHVGSVGVIWAHTDTTGAEQKAGIRTTYIYAGKHKAEGHGPLEEEATAEMQRVVNEYYGQFVAAVARGRGTTTAKVEGDFGQGRMRLAQEAVSARMADRVATLEQVLKEINAKSSNKGAAKPATSAGATLTADQRELRAIAARAASAGVPCPTSSDPVIARKQLIAAVVKMIEADRARLNRSS